MTLSTASAVAGQECPDVDPATGYPVSVMSGRAVSEAFLAAFAYATVHRWRLPSRRRNAYRGWQRVRDRILPPEPRWAADWRPEARHTATVSVIMDPDGAVSYEVREKSGDGRFDNSLETIFDEPMPGSPTFPTVPGDAPVVLTVHFGAAHADPEAATLRFAAVQTPVELVPGTLRVNSPRGGGPRPSATVKYDVSAAGRVIPGSIDVLRTSSEALSQAIAAGLRSARFVAPTSNCRAVSQTVVQTFGN